MASGVSASDGSWASAAAGARRARVLPLRPEGGIFQIWKETVVDAKVCCDCAQCVVRMRPRVHGPATCACKVSNPCLSQQVVSSWTRWMCEYQQCGVVESVSWTGLKRIARVERRAVYRSSQHPAPGSETSYYKVVENKMTSVAKLLSLVTAIASAQQEATVDPLRRKEGANDFVNRPARPSGISRVTSTDTAKPVKTLRLLRFWTMFSLSMKSLALPISSVVLSLCPFAPRVTAANDRARGSRKQTPSALRAHITQGMRHDVMKSTLNAESRVAWASI